MSKFPESTGRSLRWAVLAASLWSASVAWAIPAVTFVATDLPDTTVGQDLWQYDYSITGPLDKFYAINLLFPSATYGPITPGASDPSFDVLLTDPDPTLPAAGMATYTALSKLSATIPVAASLSFVWSGSGAPGSQPFEVLDDVFTVVIGDGRTTAAVSTSPIPEPANVLLMLGGLALIAPLAAHRRRRAR